MLHAELLSRNILTGRRVYLIRYIPKRDFGEPFDWAFTLIQPQHCRFCALLNKVIPGMKVSIELGGA